MLLVDLGLYAWLHVQAGKHKPMTVYALVRFNLHDSGCQAEKVYASALEE